jgi:hypothetical protein
MSVWRNIVDFVAQAARSEATYRRKHPAETARLFRDRQRFYLQRGWKRAARTAGNRAARWEARVLRQLGEVR